MKQQYYNFTGRQTKLKTKLNPAMNKRNRKICYKFKFI